LPLYNHFIWWPLQLKQHMFLCSSFKARERDQFWHPHVVPCTIYNTTQQQWCTTLQKWIQKLVHPPLARQTVTTPPRVTPVKDTVAARPVLSQLRKSCAGANTSYSWAWRVFIFERHFASKSFAVWVSVRRTVTQAGAGRCWLQGMALTVPGFIWRHTVPPCYLGQWRMNIKRLKDITDCPAWSRAGHV
jgi:hypothetical protein